MFLSKLLFTFGTYSFKLSVKLSTLRGVVINSLKLADGMAVYFGRSDFHGLTKLLYRNDYYLVIKQINAVQTR